MGWASGSQLAEELYAAIRKDIPAAKRKRVANQIIDRFEDHDADDPDYGSALFKDAGRKYEEEDDS